MIRRRIRGCIGLATAALFLFVSCTRDDKSGPADASGDGQASAPEVARPPASGASAAKSVSAPAAEPPRPDVIPRESLKWTAAQAVAKLSDEKLGVAAAVRLARLAKTKTAALPEPLTKEQAARLKLVRVGDDLFALGLPDARIPRAYRSVLLLNAAGAVVKPGAQAPVIERDEADASDALAQGTDDTDADALPTARNSSKPPSDAHANESPFEARPAAAKQPARGADPAKGAGQNALAAGTAKDVAVEYGDWSLYFAEDPEIFPRLLIHRTRVYDATKLDEPLLVLVSPASLRFDIRLENSYPFVPLLADNQEAEPVARYTWDPYELSFMGPAKDNLPASLGGTFELDVAASSGLQPVGGVIPEKHFENKKPPKPGQQPEEEFPPF